ncbi:long-chain acyl-CoA synthetase [Kineothrix alysoides]|uniref:Long-chain acyl-CoA synthetase n=1 Tax=Kineothrix alysoides TaxID=1469948 RepID=A0A4R1QT21_9FIRM|nr:class I adenylate-forming enzyme family protein [Kineothrix alysoides]TCL56201.1 long-chain acyl-CoA synthetase [Kineothrix alysoides]
MKYEIDNIFEVLEKQKNNKKISFIYKDEIIKYNELYIKAINISEYINSKSDIITIFFENSIDYIAAFFAVLYSGKIVLPININTHINEIENIIRNTGSDLVLTNSDCKKKIDSIQIDILDIGILDSSHMCEKVSTPQNEIAIIFPTSGTTGIPKYVQITHINLISNFLSVFKIYNLKSHEKGLMMLPFTTAFWLSVDLLPSMWTGMSNTIYDGGFSRNKCLSLIERNMINYIIMVPSLFRMILKDAAHDNSRLESLKRITLGGEKIAEKELLEFIKQFPNIVLIQGYGMTEASPVITTTTYDDYNKKVGSVGRPIDQVKIKIIDSAGNELPIGKEGRITVAGPNVMKGYLNQKTSIISNGWLETGDIGYLDKEEYLYITGREKNMIIVGGRNVFSEEIESIIMQNDMVDDVKIYGEINQIHGEIIVAEVVFKCSTMDEQEAIEEIKEYCRKFLTNYKIPKKIIIKEMIEKTITNKTKR